MTTSNEHNNAPAVQQGEPVAWKYELAVRINAEGRGSGWCWRLTDYKPSVPDGMIRNLRPLTYADAAPAVPQGEPVAAWLKAKIEKHALPPAVPESLEALSRKLDTQTPDLEVSEMINGLTQAETDASASVSGLTAAPVGDLPELPEPYRALDKHLSHPILRQVLFAPGEYFTADQMRAYARAAMRKDNK